MNERLLANLLTTFTDDVNAGRTLHTTDYLAQAPGAEAEILHFFNLIQDLSNLLVPLRARDDFKQDLDKELRAARHGRNTRRLGRMAWSPEDLPTLRSSSQFVHEMWDTRRPWVIGAALGSAVSVLGVAYVLRQRAVRAQQVPPIQ